MVKNDEKRDEKLNHVSVFDLEDYNMARTKLHSPLVNIAVKRIEKR